MNEHEPRPTWRAFLTAIRVDPLGSMDELSTREQMALFLDRPRHENEPDRQPGHAPESMAIPRQGRMTIAGLNQYSIAVEVLAPTIVEAISTAIASFDRLSEPEWELAEVKIYKMSKRELESRTRTTISSDLDGLSM